MGNFDLKTPSWVATAADIRRLGGVIFCKRRYDMGFIYHNGKILTMLREDFGSRGGDEPVHRLYGTKSMEKIVVLVFMVYSNIAQLEDQDQLKNLKGVQYVPSHFLGLESSFIFSF